MRNDDDSILESLSGDFRRFTDQLRPRLDAIKEELQETPFLVVVFGTGRRDRRRYRKRSQIRDELRKIPGVHAYFPESNDFKQLFEEHFGISSEKPVLAEVLQAAVADVIIALEPGAGVEQEVAIFSTMPRFAGKLYCLMEDKHRQTPGSFPGTLRQSLNGYHYSPEDFATCRLARVICPQHVNALRIQKHFLG